jgi:hypothetical protein
MATPAILTFPSNLAPVVPTFVGNGSKIEVPDLQVVFWGPYWPGTGQLSVGSLMQAVTTMVNGTYLDGLKQYGYVGPVNVRQPIVNTGNPNFTYPAPGPNVNQLNTAIQAVFTLVDTLRQNNSMGDVTSNHDLIVMTFIDPSFVFPQIFTATGASQSTVYGEHSTYLASRPLAPAIRFSFGLVFTQPLPGISAFDQATVTFGHELAESITNPFNGSGWVQTAPPTPNGGGEIATCATTPSAWSTASRCSPTGAFNRQRASCPPSRGTSRSIRRRRNTSLRMAPRSMRPSAWDRYAARASSTTWCERGITRWLLPRYIRDIRYQYSFGRSTAR